MRDNIKRLTEISARHLPLAEPIYEFGALQVPGQVGYADLRPFFPGREYVGADLRPGAGVDKLLDLHEIDLPTGSVGTVLCFDTLEHVEYPHQALLEIHRILKPGSGVAVISSVMDFPIHDYPHDYWRFTPAGFESLLKPFKHAFVGFAGDEEFPHTVVGVGFKGDAPDLTMFRKQYEQWRLDQEEEMKPDLPEPEVAAQQQSQDLPSQEHKPALRRVVRQLTPPILHPFMIRSYIAMSGYTDAISRRLKGRG